MSPSPLTDTPSPSPADDPFAPSLHHGVHADVEVRGSPIHGHGVFALRPIPAETLIGRYEGRRYTPDEVESRPWNQALTYVFGLSDGTIIDADEGGNATRHVNHACEPNCIAYEVEDESGRLDIVIETLRPIDAGEELLLDYALDVGDEDPSRYACRCGSPTCRGTMVGPVRHVDPAGTAEPAAPGDPGTEHG